jgi:hypothetical protein
MASASSGNLELHENSPREQVGAVTGEKYEFQYHQAAADALQVLDDTSVVCVYFEWHDDYVIESAGVISYRFHQVKTRSLRSGPWTINEFFGIKKARGRMPAKGPAKLAAVDKSSIFSKLYDHVGRFGTRCGGFVFVTENVANLEFDALLRDTRAAKDHTRLVGNSLNEFQLLHGALVTAFPLITKEDLFGFLQKFIFQSAIGREGELRGARLQIAGRILDASEVDLKTSEAEKIGGDLVSLVRAKSHRTLNTLPGSREDLRTEKGIILDDVLKVIGLSASGYRELKVAGRSGVIALSRLQRILKRSGADDALITQFCSMKTAWDAWWIGELNNISRMDAASLKDASMKVLRLHVSGNLDFNGLGREAKQLSSKFSPILTSTTPLTPDLVFGQFLALAVETDL